MTKKNAKKVSQSQWYEPGEIDNKSFFVGYPYEPRLFNKENFQNQIRKAFEGTGFEPYFYDEHFKSEIVTRKILKKVHDSFFAVFDISDGNPNVLIEIGFALGVNKEVFILKHKGSTFIIPSDIEPIERIEYDDIIDLEDKLKQAFLESKLGRGKSA